MVLCVYTVIRMFNCGTVTHRVKVFEGISQENKCGHDLVKTFFFYIPGPELIASRLQTLHTHNTRLSWHTEPRKVQLPCPFQNVLPLDLIVDVMAIDPKSSENLFDCIKTSSFLGSLIGTLFVIYVCALSLIHWHSRKNTHITTAVFRKVGVEVGVKHNLL